MKRVIIVTIILILAACSGSNTARYVQKPRSFVFKGSKYQDSVAVVLPAKLRTMKEEYRPGSTMGSGGGFEIKFGETLVTMLQAGADFVYSDVFLLEKMPQPGEFDRIIKITDEDTHLDNEIQASTNNTAAFLKYHVKLNIESFNGTDLSSLKKSRILGESTFRSGISMNQNRDRLAEAIEDAINQAAERMANLLGRGFAEPAK